MKIITNKQWRDFICGYDVPESVKQSEYCHLSDVEACDGFIKYRGNYYHLSDFLVTDDISEWQGVHCDSAFSGILIKVLDDGEQYQIAHFYN